MRCLLGRRSQRLPVFRLHKHFFLDEDADALVRIFCEAGRASPNRPVLNITVLRRAAELRENADALAPRFGEALIAAPYFPVLDETVRRLAGGQLDVLAGTCPAGIRLKLAAVA